MLCRDASLVKHLTNVRIIHPLKCRCWHCERCAPERREDLKGLARRGNPNRFLTLTIRPKPGNTADQEAQRLRHAWLLLRRCVLRRYGWKHLPFLAVFERHKSGMPHLHIMLRCGYLPQRWLSQQMDRLIDSPIVDIKHITDKGRVAGYVAKYISECPEKFQGVKRYWRSLDYELPENKYVKPEADEDAWWSLSATRPEVMVRIAMSDGYTVQFDGKYWRICGVFEEG